VRIGAIGESTPCPATLAPTDLTALNRALKDANDLLGLASVAFDGLSDFADITFLLPTPLPPELETEVAIPIELFPVRLVPLLELVDSLAVKACGARYAPLVPAVRKSPA
jgi:hypothetical protein